MQVEDRWVNSKLAPDHLGKSFNHITPNEYWLRVAPLQGVDYQLSSIPDRIAVMLQIPTKEAVILSKNTLAKPSGYSRRWASGNRYQFTGSF